MNEDGALLLERRAAALARPVELAHPTATMQVLVLAVAGGHRYAVESRYVDQVAHNARLCRLPASPGQLLGLLPVRGEAVPVTDLATLAGVAAAADPSRPFAVVLAGNGDPLGLLVDEVITAGDVACTELRPVERGLTEACIERGVTADGTVLLDVDTLLADPRVSYFPHAEPSPDAATSD